MDKSGGKSMKSMESMYFVRFSTDASKNALVDKSSDTQSAQWFQCHNPVACRRNGVESRAP